MGSLKHRRRSEEWMDRPDADPRQVDAALAYIRRVNRLLGYTRATLSHFDRFARGWTPGRPITILDVGTGSGDIPLAMIARFTPRFDLHIAGVDLHPHTAAVAQAEANPRFRVVRADALDLPFADGSFDYAMTNMFLHHLDDDQAVRAVREMDRVARRGVLAADLARSRRAAFWIRLFTLLSHPMVRHDAVASVAQAFTCAEAVSLATRAGLSYVALHTHFAHRFVLAGEK